MESKDSARFGGAAAPTFGGPGAALVTGAGAGLGRAIAVALARCGDAVMVCDIDPDGGRETVAVIEAAGGTARFEPCNVAVPADAERAVAACLDAFGRLDRAVNNAGIEGARAAVADYGVDEWRRVIDINLGGVFFCLRAEIPAMLAGGGGAIVNIGSTASLGGVAGMPAYTAAKHGLLGLTRAAALDYADRGIRINAVCPGSFRTAMSERLFGDALDTSMVATTPMGRLGGLDEIAAAVLFLLSDAASFVTGAALPVEGGKRAR